MERSLYGTALLDEGREIRYYFLTDQARQQEESCGVLVEFGGEEAAIMDLSPSRRRVRSLLGRMSRGTVTPVALRDVVDDWLLE